MTARMELSRLIPRDPQANLKARLALLAYAEGRPHVQAELLAICKDDFFFWTDLFCIAEGTQVLTARGAVAIECVTAADLVWDGQEWVGQEGPVYRGCKPVIFAYGIYLTPDHQVLTNHGWRNAIEGHDRARVRLPHGYPQARFLQGDVAGGVAVPLQMRQAYRGLRCELAGRKKFEVQEMLRAETNPRQVEDAALCGLDDDEGSMHQSQESGVRGLRGEGHQGLRAVDEVRELLGRHGRMPEGIDPGPLPEQRRQLRTEQLSLGHAKAAGQQYTQQRGDSDFPWTDAIVGSGKSGGRFSQGDSRSPDVWPQWRCPAGAEQTASSHVYDLVNCGPRRAFTVIGNDGKLLLVHNCWQVNPRHVGAEFGPWITYDFQRDAVTRTKAWLDAGEDVIWEKSRYLGATWLALLMQVHEALFNSFQKFLDISHSEKAVDSKNDPDSLFWKVEFVLRHLPDWMRRGAEKPRAGSVEFPATESIMTGAATTERAGVGGRARWVLLDEFAKQKDDYAIWGQTADTGPRHVVSTHYGLNSQWHSLTQRDDVNRCLMHWSMHPEMNPGLYRVVEGKVEILDKSYRFPDGYPFVTDGTPTGGPFPSVRSPWYDRECLRRNNPRDVAMHLDIDVKGSVAQYFPPALIHRLKRSCWMYRWEGDLAYDRDSATPIMLVPRIDGPLKLWIEPTVDGRVPKARYVFGTDISHGLGATPTCLSIGRADTGVKIGEYVNAHIAPEPYAAFFVALARLFSDGEMGAFAIWERQGPGQTFAKKLFELGYRNVWYPQTTDAFGSDRSEVAGWYPTGESKRMLMDQYMAALNDGTYTNPSERALEQCLSYRYDLQGNPEHPKQKNNKEDPSAGGVNHGDIVTADALMGKILRETVTRIVQEKKEEVPVGSFQWRRELRKQLVQESESY